MSHNVLRLTEVNKRFGGLKAVDDLTFQVVSGSVFGLMGPNGAGKTSALNLITGLVKADSGQIQLGASETDVTSYSPHRRARLGINRTYQNVRLFAGLTAREQVISGMYTRRKTHAWEAVAFLSGERRERRECRDRADELLERVGVTTSPHTLAEELAYGQQRRVEIARALASDPSLLLLDEPTAGMNHAEATRIGELIRQLNGEGLAIIVIEHNMRLILEYCDQALVMSFGKKIAEGTPEECVSNELVQEAYFGRNSDAERLRALRALRIDQGS
jgi:branched-chain amino acid transport system ATP-binding protein